MAYIVHRACDSMNALFTKMLQQPGGSGSRSFRAPAEEPAHSAGDGLETPEESDATEEAARALDPQECLALELGDFVPRIPPSYLKPGPIDLQKPLLFELNEVAGHIAKGITTLKIQRLIDMAPEIFQDLAQVERNLEIRFPWRKVMEMLRASKSEAPQAGQETLTEKLRRRRSNHGTKARPGSNSLSAGGGWPERSQIDERARAQGAIRLAPLPTQSVPPADHGAAPTPPDRQASSKKPAEIPDLLFASPGAPIETAETAGEEDAKSEQKTQETEAQPLAVPESNRQEGLELHAGSERFQQHLRTAVTEIEAKLAAEFCGELERLLAGKHEQYAKQEAELRGIIASQQMELAELQITGLQAPEPDVAELMYRHAGELSSHEARANRIVAQLRTELDVLARSTDRAAAEYESRLTALAVERDSALAASRSELDRELARMEAEHRQECERLRRERDEAASKAAAAEAALAEKAAEIESLKSEHRSALLAVEDAWEKALSAMAEERDEIAAAQEALASKEMECSTLRESAAAAAAAHDAVVARLEGETVRLAAETHRIVDETMQRCDAAEEQRDAMAGEVLGLRAALLAARSERDNLLAEKGLNAAIHSHLERLLRSAETDQASSIFANVLATRNEAREHDHSSAPTEQASVACSVQEFLDALREYRLRAENRGPGSMTEAA